MGGVVTTDDALQFLMAGASAVQVGTATFREPRTAERIVTGLCGYLDDRGYESVHDVVGLARRERLSD
jgi:dihydroorotate dehydrogenase (NAD+) catalytic subunit